MQKICKILFFQLLAMFMAMSIFQSVIALETRTSRHSFTPNDEKLPLSSSISSKEEREDSTPESPNKHNQIESNSNKESFEVSALFFFQGGLGFVFNQLPTSLSNQINTIFIPTASLSIGYNQLFRFGAFSSGIRIMIAYELGLAPSSGSTVVYRSNSAYGIIYLGYGRFLPYIGGGYAVADIGESFYKRFFVSSDKNSSKGGSAITGLVFNIDKHSSVDISFRFYLFRGNYPNIFASYEFRF